MRILAGCVVLLVSLGLTQQSSVGQPRTRGCEVKRLILDCSKPFAYVSVERFGIRIPRDAGESTDGVWLSLYNNTSLTIKGPVLFDSLLFGKADVIIQDMVVRNWSFNSDVSGGVGHERSFDECVIMKDMPLGYFNGSSQYATIFPGKSVTFSVPRNHVSDHWHLDIPLLLEFDQNVDEFQPRAYVSVYEEDLAKARSRLRAP